MNDYNVESLFAPIEDQKLHLKRIYKKNSQLKNPVLMIHGAVENGRVFYSKSGKGLAFFLAKESYDVYVADLRGRGESSPKVSKNSTFNQNDILTKDFHAYIDTIKKQNTQSPIMITHSWGGVLVNSFLARYPEISITLKAIVHISVKRSVHVINKGRILYIDLLWNCLAKLAVKYHGYLPAMFIGSDTESKGTHQDSVTWVKKSKWIDPTDDFNYYKAARENPFPPTLWITGKGDKCLGHPDDMKRFMKESNQENAPFLILSKENGNALDYDHINILTSNQALSDHFPKILDFIND